MTINRLLTLKGVTESAAIKRSQIYLLISRGKFPKPVKIGRASRWLESEVQQWISDQIAARGAQ